MLPYLYRMKQTAGGFPWLAVKYRNRNLGISDCALNKCSTSVAFYNRAALFPRSRVVLTPGQHLKLGARPVCSGRACAFQRSSERRGCSWTRRRPLARLFTGNCAHLLGLEHVRPSRSRRTHAFIQVFPDYRWKSLIPGRPFIGLGLLPAAFH